MWDHHPCVSPWVYLSQTQEGATWHHVHTLCGLWIGCVRVDGHVAGRTENRVRAQETTAGVPGDSRSGRSGTRSEVLWQWRLLLSFALAHCPSNNRADISRLSLRWDMFESLCRLCIVHRRTVYGWLPLHTPTASLWQLTFVSCRPQCAAAACIAGHACQRMAPLTCALSQHCRWEEFGNSAPCSHPLIASPSCALRSGQGAARKCRCTMSLH